jgi:hypothetical protein
MRRFARPLLTLATAVSLFLWLAAGVLWVRTEAMGRTDTLVWGEAGVYRCLEFSQDDAEYKVLRDPGYARSPFRWHARGGGWLRPPAPSTPGALPPGSVTWIMPSPAHLANGRFDVSDGGKSLGAFAASAHGGVPTLGFEYASFPGWYGPGTRLDSWRFSYFLVLIPAAVLPAWWLARFAVRRWRFGRFGPGLCRACGYDLRASPGRCPECGVVPGNLVTT